MRRHGERIVLHTRVWIEAFRGGRALPLDPLRGKILTHLNEGILAAEEVARLLVAEGCPAFLDTYYRKRYRPAAGSTLTRLRRPSDPERA